MYRKTYEQILAENKRFLEDRGLKIRKMEKKEDIRLSNERIVGILFSCIKVMRKKEAE